MSQTRRRRQSRPRADQVDKEVTVRLTDMAHQGEALGRVDGKVAFATFGIPGEDVRLRVQTEKAQFMSGEVTEVLAPSPYRATPRCPHFGSCGGCQLQHIDYGHQLELKQRVLAQQLRRIGKLVDPPVRPTLPSPQQWYYRNHARFSVTRSGLAGFTHRNSHRFVPIDWCYIMHPWINRAKAALEEKAAGSHQLAIRYGVSSGDYLVQPTLNADTGGYETGQGSYIEKVYGVSFRVSAPSFFQVNTLQAERMVALVRDRLELRETDTLVDAYAGVGVFAVLLAPFVSKVVAIEESRAAVQDAEVNIEGFHHIELVQARTEEGLPSLEIPADVVILDPPRTGCYPAVLEALAQVRPRKVAYVSCDPATLARDLHALVLKGFRVEEVQPVDMFPQTYHIESITTLSPMSESDLLLASTSPRRRELLAELGLPFQALVPSGEEETWKGLSPEEHATANATAKAMSIAREARAGTIIGADTVVVLDGQVLSKPRDADEARAMLQSLRGREHRVVTGVAVARAGETTPLTATCSTVVQMRDYTDTEIERYIESGDPFDKAGGYAIQDSNFQPVASCDGCPTNVIGLPLCTLSELLRQVGVQSVPETSCRALCQRRYSSLVGQGRPGPRGNYLKSPLP